jgi:hypothetical protein
MIPLRTARAVIVARHLFGVYPWLNIVLNEKSHTLRNALAYVPYVRVSQLTLIYFC